MNEDSTKDLGVFSQVGCKILSLVRIMTVTREEAPANFVPAAAVIRRELALFGITGRKGRAGGLISQM